MKLSAPETALGLYAYRFGVPYQHNSTEAPHSYTLAAGNIDGTPYSMVVFIAPALSFPRAVTLVEGTAITPHVAPFRFTPMMHASSTISTAAAFMHGNAFTEQKHANRRSVEDLYLRSAAQELGFAFAT